MDKGEVARRLLGTALDMFLRPNQDPVSIHCLAMAGGEIAEGLAKNAGVAPFLDHITATFPDRKIEDIRNIQRQFYNAFKHMFTRDGKERQDQDVLERFDAAINDHTYFTAGTTVCCPARPARSKHRFSKHGISRSIEKRSARTPTCRGLWRLSQIFQHCRRTDNWTAYAT
jgi:hypothetical protein